MTLRTLGGGLDILWAPRPVVRRLSVLVGEMEDEFGTGWLMDCFRVCRLRCRMTITPGRSAFGWLSRCD